MQTLLDNHRPRSLKHDPAEPTYWILLQKTKDFKPEHLRRPQAAQRTVFRNLWVPEPNLSWEPLSLSHTFQFQSIRILFQSFPHSIWTCQCGFMRLMRLHAASCGFGLPWASGLNRKASTTEGPEVPAKWARCRGPTVSSAPTSSDTIWHNRNNDGTKRNSMEQYGTIVNLSWHKMFQNVSVVNQSPVHIFSHPETTAGYIYGAVWWIRCRVLQDSCLGCLAIEDQPKMVGPKQNLKHSETLSCEADCPNLPTSQPPNLPTSQPPNLRHCLCGERGAYDSGTQHGWKKPNLRLELL